MKDLADRADVEELVVAFYRAAFIDPLLGPVFIDVAKMDLERHLPIMCDFWETVLFRTGSYRRNALQAHLALHALSPLGEEHFERWYVLWSRAVDAHYRGPVADHAKLQAGRIAGAMLRRLTGQPGAAFEDFNRHHEQERSDAHAVH